MATLKMGVDVGNFDTKTAHTEMVSGFKTFLTKPDLSKEYIEKDGKFYVLTSERFKYKQDKTENEHAEILTLFGIAKEILFRINRGKELTREEQQQSIDKISAINLGVGLPPLHCNRQAAKTKEYYENRLKNIEFNYKGFHFVFTTKNVFVFPQGYAAVQASKKCKYITYPKFYVIDIGGYTVDVITMVNGSPDLSLVDSKSLGVLKLFQNIKSEVLRLEGFSLDDFIIESVILGKPHTLPERVVNFIKANVSQWANTIINELRESGIEFLAYPCVFVGGGSLVFRNDFDSSSEIGEHEYITDTHANAIGYERLLSVVLSE